LRGNLVLVHLPKANSLKADRFGWLTPVKLDAAEPVHA
jgi:hypothetical protein